MQRLWSALRITLALCFMPLLMGAAICLLFFSPTWVLLWLISRPKHRAAWLRFKVAVWEEWWHIRGAYLPQKVSAQTRGLYAAIQSGDAGTVELLLERGADPNACLFYGIPLLIQAADCGHTRIVKTLLEAGAKIDAKAPILNYTALIQAARGGYEDTVRCLLEHGADIRVQDIYGHEPLIAATVANNSGVVHVLLEYYKQEPALPSVCRLALTFANKQGCREISAMLQEAGAIPLPHKLN